MVLTSLQMVVEPNVTCRPSKKFSPISTTLNIPFLPERDSKYSLFYCKTQSLQEMRRWPSPVFHPAPIPLSGKLP